MNKRNGTNTQGKFTTEDWQALTLLIAVGLYLSFKTPGWIAAYFGWTKVITLILAWIDKQNAWLEVLLYLLYAAAGALAVLTALFVVFMIVALLYELVKALGKGLLALLRYSGPHLLRALWMLVRLSVWPLTATYRGLRGYFAERRAIRAERKQLHRMYQAEYADDFRSFREFKRYWDAVARGEARPHPGKDKDNANSNQQQEQKEKTKDRKREEDRPPPDRALEDAIRVLKLPKSFSKEKLETHYRKLMSKAHPDRGGSAKLAAQLNQARKLIKQRRGWT